MQQLAARQAHLGVEQVVLVEQARTGRRQREAGAQRFIQRVAGIGDGVGIFGQQRQQAGRSRAPAHVGAEGEPVARRELAAMLGKLGSTERRRAQGCIKAAVHRVRGRGLHGGHRIVLNFQRDPRG